MSVGGPGPANDRGVHRRYPLSLVGTAKRERQKANRRQRLEAQARGRRAGTIRRNVRRIGIGAIATVGVAVLVVWLGGAFDGEETEAAENQVIDDASTEVLPTPPKPDVVLPDSIPTSLVVTDIVEGDGAEAQVGDTVVVHYVGVRTEDGTEFDNSYDRGQPFPVVLGSGSVIQGWEQGLIGAQAGDQRQLDIPAELAYGDTPRGDVIQAGDALTFVIDVVAVTPGAGG